MVKVKVKKEDKEKRQEPESLQPQESEAEPQAAPNLSQAQAPEGSTQAETEFAELKKKLAELERQNLYLRADFANYKRNMEQERTQFLDQGKELVLKDLFVIFEHLERAINAVKEHNPSHSVLEGLELVQKEFLKIFEKHGIERIKTIGEKFDPKFHDAVSVMSSPEQEPGIIIYEHQPGFIRNGKVIQPARVVVSGERD